MAYLKKLPLYFGFTMLLCNPAAFAEMQELTGNFTADVHPIGDYTKSTRETLHFRYDLKSRKFSADVVDERGDSAFSASGTCSEMTIPGGWNYSMNQTRFACTGETQDGAEIEITGVRAVWDENGVCVKSSSPLTSSEVERRSGIGMDFNRSSQAACYVDQGGGD